MIDGFEDILSIHPAYLNDLVIRATHRFVATALWGADENVRAGMLKHLPPLTREYLHFEIEAYEGRPDDGVDETQQKMLELLTDQTNSEFYQETVISTQRYGPSVHLKGSQYDHVVEYVLELASKIHTQGMASIVPDAPNCPIPFLRLGLELLLLNIPWDDINGILWGHIRTHRMRNGQFDGGGRWLPDSDGTEREDRLLAFCLVACSALQLHAHPVLVNRSLQAFSGNDYARLRAQRTDAEVSQ